MPAAFRDTGSLQKTQFSGHDGAGSPQGHQFPSENPAPLRTWWGWIPSGTPAPLRMWLMGAARFPQKTLLPSGRGGAGSPRGHQVPLRATRSPSWPPAPLRPWQPGAGSPQGRAVAAAAGPCGAGRGGAAASVPPPVADKG